MKKYFCEEGLTRDKVARIRELNDNFRNSFRGGKIVLTASVAELPDMVKVAALHQVATFKDFNEANDPHGEHDFLKFKVCDRDFIFSIVYYDLKMECASPLPCGPQRHRETWDFDALIRLVN